MNASPIEQFRDAIRSLGLIPPDVIEADGSLHRFPSNGRKGDGAGCYVLHLDGIPAGWIGDWRTGISTTWRAEIGRTLTPIEEAAHNAKIRIIQEERKAEESRRQAKARERANLIWKESTRCTNHPYLKRKSIQANGTRLYKDSLVIPVREGDVLHSLQFINGNGDKKFLLGGKVQGCYYSMGNPDGAAALCISEGFSTSSTLRKATGHPVAVAFNAGNLLVVAKIIREKFPKLPLIICGDDDRKTDGNPGLTKANEAALAVGGLVALPPFTDEELAADPPPSDWNDFAALHGLEAVGRALTKASPPSDTKATPESNNDNQYESAVKKLAALKPHQFDRVRKEESKKLRVQLKTLETDVKAARQESNQDDPPFTDIEPYSKPIVPTQLLDDITDTIQRFIVLDKHQAQAAALWVSACWFLDVIHAAPIALINAPEKTCGKTQLLTVLGKLAPRAAQASGISPSVLFRMIEAYQPTLFIDEIETVLKDNDELRGLINAGHTRDSAYVWRSVPKGDDFVPTRFRVWGMKAIAGINAIKLAETVTSRSIIFELRRKKEDEKVQRLREAEPDLFSTLSARLARFAEDYSQQVREARPTLPEALSDRDQDNFEPLLAIAGVAGGHWPDTAFKAALKLSGESGKLVSTSNELLADIQHIFKHKNKDKIKTADLISALIEDEEKSWATYYLGKPINPKHVARLLKNYGIASKTIRLSEYDTPKGFELSQFSDAFMRYLPTPLNLPPQPPQTLEANKHEVLSVAGRNTVTPIKTLSATPKPAPDKACGVVAGNKPISGGDEKEFSKTTHLRI